MKRIKTPKGFALMVAVVISFLYVIIASISYVLFKDRIIVLEFLITYITLFLSTYFVVYYLLERLISSKIRLIYRVVHSNETNPIEKQINMNEDVLSETEHEVVKWGKKKSEEIKKLKEQEQFRREFLGNLAHELKTPIFSIQGYILTLLEGGLEDEKINRTFLERANKGVDRITRVVEDLDLITEIESGRIILNQSVTNIVTLAKDVLDSFEIKAKKHNVLLKLETDFEFQNVFCDKDKIEQVLINLINNSINYGTLNGVTKLRLFDSEDHVLIEVADNGIGIAKEHLSRLFERFYRIDKSRARHEGGTGLGLSIVKHIVEAHKQTISVRSELGKGSVFYFYLKKV